MDLSAAFGPFRHRRFALLWAGAFISNIGTWMEAVGVGILVTTSTGQAGWAGLVAAAGFVPTALLAPLGGALADRLPRRTLILATTSFQILFAGLLTLAASVGDPSPGLVTLLVLGAGCANAIGFPAYQAMLPDLVPRNDVPGAVALSSAQWNLGRVIGPALAGLVIGLGGYELAFLINTLSFFAVFAVIASFRLPRPTSSGGASILQSIREGARFVRGDPALRFVVGCMALNSLLAAPFIALIPAVALKVFDDEKFGTAALVTAQGIGAVCMALTLAGVFARFGVRRVMLTILGALPVALLAYALAPVLPLAIVAIFFVGLPVPRLPFELHDDRPAARPGCVARPGGERADDAHRRAVPHRQRRPGRDRRRDRPAGDDGRGGDPARTAAPGLEAAAARCRRRARRHGHDRGGPRRERRRARARLERWLNPRPVRARRLSLELKYAAIRGRDRRALRRPSRDGRVHGRQRRP